MYTLTENINQVRKNSDGIVFNCIDGLIYYEKYKIWLSEGNIPNPAPQKTFEQLSAEIDLACDKHYDEVAAARGWGRVGITPSAACSARSGYQNPWQAESIKFCQWVDSCVAYLIAEKSKVVAGIRTMPTPEQAIAELPSMVW